MSTGQFLRITVKQQGIDVAIALHTPDGKKISEADSDPSIEGSETMSAISESAGAYLIEVRSPEKTAKSGRYEIRAEELRAATTAAKRSIDASWRSKLADLPRGLRGALWMTTAVAALLFVLGGTWLAIETSWLRARLVGARREVEEQQRRAQTQARLITELEARYKKLTEEYERLQAQLQAVQDTAPPTSHIAPVFLTLSVEDFRNSGAQEPQALVIPRRATDARLRLYLPENVFPSYRVTLSTEDGNEVFRKNGLKPRADKGGDFVIVNLPVSNLRTGDKVLALSGISLAGEIEPLGKSLIKVRKR